MCIEENLLDSKIIILSFQRNATQSVWSFLNSYGLKGIHHINGKINSSNFKGCSLHKIKKEIEQYEKEFTHFSDAPYFLMYKHFDEKYPNSKFILITRDKNEWLKSFKKLWLKEGPADPVSFACYQHYIEDITSYNILDLSDEELVNMYSRHNNDVVEYFKNKHNLLVIDIHDVQKKEKITSFLNILPKNDFNNVDYIRSLHKIKKEYR
jgi:hypothetical protein